MADELKKKIGWYYDGREPNACGASGCKEEMNGLWFAKIQVGRARFWITACEECKAKAELRDKPKKNEIWKRVR